MSRLPALRSRAAETERRIASMTPDQRATVAEVFTLMAGDNVTELGVQLARLGALAHALKDQGYCARPLPDDLSLMAADELDGRLALVRDRPYGSVV